MNDFLDGLTIWVAIIVLAFGIPIFVLLCLCGHVLWAYALAVTFIFSIPYMDEI